MGSTLPGQLESFWTSRLLPFLNRHYMIDTKFDILYNCKKSSLTVQTKLEAFFHQTLKLILNIKENCLLTSHKNVTEVSFTLQKHVHNLSLFITVVLQNLSSCIAFFSHRFNQNMPKSNQYITFDYLEIILLIFKEIFLLTRMREYTESSVSNVKPASHQNKILRNKGKRHMFSWAPVTCRVSWESMTLAGRRKELDERR